MSTLAYRKVAIGGTNPQYAAASAGGDKVAANPRGFLLVRNGGGSSITVTVAVPGNTKYGQAAPDVAVTVPNATDRLIGPFPDDLADRATDNLVAITYSGVTSVTVAAIEI